MVVKSMLQELMTLLDGIRLLHTGLMVLRTSREGGVENAGQGRNILKTTPRHHEVQ